SSRSSWSASFFSQAGKAGTWSIGIAWQLQTDSFGEPSSAHSKRRRSGLREKPRIEPYDKPSGGWGSARAVAKIFRQEGGLLSGPRTIRRQNKPMGFACVGGAWSKPAEPHVVEACESGIKATAWEITSKRVPLEFFATRTLTELDRKSVG